MIDKEKAQEFNRGIIDSEETLQKEEQSKITKIKEILPNIVNSDNQLNIEALQELLDTQKATTYNQKGYELTFSGKALANSKATEPTEKELKIEKEQSKNFDNTENIIIRGDNIDALKILKQNYFEKIKMIYIDPPYNTKSDEFIYNDNFKETEANLIEKFNMSEDDINYFQNIYGTKTHSGWLSFMYPRLKLARDLLKEDGVIFISIDDNEQANLKLMCDEIFGEENFVNAFIRKTVSNRAMAQIINTQHEYLLCYVKNKVNEFLRGEDKDLSVYQNPDNDPRGAWVIADPSSSTSKNIFEVINPFTQKKDIPPRGRGWTFKKTEIEKLIEEKKMVFKKEHKDNERGFFIKRYKKDLKSNTKLINSLNFTDNEYMNQKATKDMLDLIDKNIFTYTKPYNFIQKLTSYSTGEEDIILDFFAGSGTTAHAVMELNKEDGGNRKCILVQWDEKIKENTEASKFCLENNFEPVISSITIERINRAGEKILKDNEEAKDKKDLSNLDIGYKVFSLTNKPKLVEKNGQFEIENLYKNDFDILINMMAKTGIELNSKIEKTENPSIYKVKNNYYVIKELTDLKLIESIKNEYIYINGFANMNLEQFLNSTNNNNKDNIKIVY